MRDAAPRQAWLTLVGIGEDGVAGLSEAARTAIAGAALVVGGARHLRLADALISGERRPWPSPMTLAYPDILARAGQPVVVLASGDPFCFGVGSVLAKLVPAHEIACLPAPSAVALACARLSWAQQEVVTVSFCGRPLEAVIPLLQPGCRLLALSADAATPAAFAALLLARGFGGSALHILEAIGGPGERIRTARPAAIPTDIGPLNLVAAELAADADARILPLAPGLPDALFEHDGQLTKQEVRAATIAALAPRAGAMLWDIGAGSGSVAIEWCLRGSGCRAIAIEARPDRAARARRNATALGATTLDLVEGEAPSCLERLPSPNAIFIGGGLQRSGVLDAAWSALRPGGRLVANAIALDTQGLLFDAQARRGGTLTRLAVERLDQVGSMRAFRPAMAVVQWAATKP